MATTSEFMEKIAPALAEADATVKKMFGEYGVYAQGKMYAVICDNRFLVKITPSSEALLPDAPRELPYAGAKPMLRADETDRELMKALAVRVPADLPAPRKRK